MNTGRDIPLALMAMLFALPVLAQDITRLGGDLTSDLSPDVAIQFPSPNIASEERREAHLKGHRDFHRSFEFARKRGRRVIGPNFNHSSCGGCHVNDGRGPVGFSSEPPGSTMLVKVSFRELNEDGTPKNIPGVGEQLQDHSARTGSRFGIKLRWKRISGEYPDGTRYRLRRPVLSFDIPGVQERKVVTSLRMTPPVIGMGLLEAVPDQAIEAMSDPDDLDGDGISGQVSYVIDHETGETVIGRFGFRATQPSLELQSAHAFFHDMGMTSRLFTRRKEPVEVEDGMLARVVFYQQAAGVTPARDQDNPEVIAGKALFQEIGCAGCHRMTLRTGDSPVDEVAFQEFHPFTDLLLHDMGPGLADERPEFSASGAEWRTTPLWGLGLFNLLSEKKPGFLHDGRARTIEEAILWHGGEAEGAREKFKALERAERERLIRFLRSL